MGGYGRSVLGMRSTLATAVKRVHRSVRLEIDTLHSQGPCAQAAHGNQIVDVHKVPNVLVPLVPVAKPLQHGTVRGIKQVRFMHLVVHCAILVRLQGECGTQTVRCKIRRFESI